MTTLTRKAGVWRILSGSAACHPGGGRRSAECSRCPWQRRVAGAVGVSGATTYRWVRQFGGQLLPVVALFGVVRSSGVVGVDEKWVQVPTNDKPVGKQKKWMYV